jgi:hypothetical protein
MNLIIDPRKCPGTDPRVDYPFVYDSNNNKDPQTICYDSSWPGGFRVTMSMELLFHTVLKYE